MSGLKDLIFFIVGLLLIICGFLSFVLIPASSQLEIDVSYNLLIGIGCLLIILGSLSMYLFLRTEDKKKKSKE